MQAVEAVIGRLHEDPIADLECRQNQLEVFLVDEPVAPGSVAVIPAAVPIAEIDLNTMRPLALPNDRPNIRGLAPEPVVGRHRADLVTTLKL